jgi:prephenate dehydratase
MKKVAFQGEHGAFSEIASKFYFGEEVNNVPSYSFDEVFSNVKNGKVDFGIVPIENTLYGSVFETYDLLLKYSLTITGELNLQINHYLIAQKKYKLQDIKRIYSHPQALGQCSEFLSRFKKTHITPAYDTAGAAILALENKTEPSAAIASIEAAEFYNLEVLESNIQNNKENYTRFLVICQKKSNKKIKNPKTSICFELKSIPGALFKALSVFALRDIDLVKIESRPIPQKPFQYTFYVDLLGNLEDERIVLAINNLSEISNNIRKFGTYNIGETFSS